MWEACFIGREVFSAISNFVTDVRKLERATFMGEPTGGSPNHYGDAVAVVLPNSDITVNVSTIYHQSGGPNDPRLEVSPDFYIPLLAEDYLGARDPVMEQLAMLTAPSLPCANTP